MSQYPQNYQQWGLNRLPQSEGQFETPAAVNRPNVPPGHPSALPSVDNFMHHQQLPDSSAWNPPNTSFQSQPPSFNPSAGQKPYHPQPAWYHSQPVFPISDQRQTHYSAAPPTEFPQTSFPQYSDPYHYSRVGGALQQPEGKRIDQEVFTHTPSQQRADNASVKSSDSHRLDNRTQQSDTGSSSAYQFEVLQGARNVEKQPFSYQAYGRQNLGEPPLHLGLASQKVVVPSISSGGALSDVDPQRFQMNFGVPDWSAGRHDDITQQQQLLSDLDPLTDSSQFKAACIPSSHRAPPPLEMGRPGCPPSPPLESLQARDLTAEPASSSIMGARASESQIHISHASEGGAVAITKESAVDPDGRVSVVQRESWTSTALREDALLSPELVVDPSTTPECCLLNQFRPSTEGHVDIGTLGTPAVGIGTFVTPAVGVGSLGIPAVGIEDRQASSPSTLSRDLPDIGSTLSPQSIDARSLEALDIRDSVMPSKLSTPPPLSSRTDKAGVAAETDSTSSVAQSSESTMRFLQSQVSQRPSVGIQPPGTAATEQQIDHQQRLPTPHLKPSVTESPGVSHSRPPIYASPFDSSSGSSERPQLKEVAFYAGAHPALGNRNVSAVAASPAVFSGPLNSQYGLATTAPPHMGSGRTPRPNEPFQHPRPATPAMQGSHAAHKDPHALQPEPTPLNGTTRAEDHQRAGGSLFMEAESAQRPGTPLSVKAGTIAVGYGGPAFVFDSQGQQIDLTVALATVEPMMVHGSSTPPSSEFDSWINISRALRGHQGPLAQVPTDHICRLLDFYVEQSYQALVASNGKDKSVLLWLLLRHICRADVSPVDMRSSDVLAFAADCYSLPSLNLINDCLPKLKAGMDLPSSCLPLSVIQQNAGPPPSRKNVEDQDCASTAWADVAKQVCSGQAASAVEFAVNFGMFAHALSISLLVSNDCFNAVRVEYAAMLNPLGQPSRAQYWIKQSGDSGAQPQYTPAELLHADCVRMLLLLHALPPAIRQQDVVETEKKFLDILREVDDLASTWLTRLRVVVSYVGLNHPNCSLWLSALGRELVNREEIHAGHCCLVLAGWIPCRDFGLLGSSTPLEHYLDAANNYDAHIPLDWKHFQITEFFDRIIKKNESPACFELLKFLYSRVLRIAGHREMADRYLSLVNPTPESVLSSAIENEARLFNVPCKFDASAGGSATLYDRIGTKFGISSLIKNLLGPEE